MFQEVNPCHPTARPSTRPTIKSPKDKWSLTILVVVGMVYVEIPLSKFRRGDVEAVDGSRLDFPEYLLALRILVAHRHCGAGMIDGWAHARRNG